RIFVGKIAGQHMHALRQLTGKLVKCITPRSGDRNRRPLRMQRARNRATDAAGGAGHKRSFAGKIEHAMLLVLIRYHKEIFRENNQARRTWSAATSAGAPIAVPVIPSTMRLPMPVSALPEPTS